MVIATMNDKASQKQTLLIDKEDFDMLNLELNTAKEALQEARREIVRLKAKSALLTVDLRCEEEEIALIENNIFCRAVLWLDVRIKRWSAYLRKRFDAWVERKWGSVY